MYIYICIHINFSLHSMHVYIDGSYGDALPLPVCLSEVGFGMEIQQHNNNVHT